MRRVQPKLVVTNITLLVFLVLPLVLALIGAVEMLRGGGGKFNIAFAAGSLLLYGVVYSIPALVGGVLHQAVLILLPAEWSDRRMRVAAVLLSPLVLVGVALAGQPVQVMLWFIAPLLLGTVIFGLVCGLPKPSWPVHSGRGRST